MGGNNLFTPTGSIQMPQNSRKFIDLAQQQHDSLRDECNSRSQGMDSKIPNPSHQAYLQYALHASQQKLNPGMHPQHHMNPGFVLPPSGKEQEMWMGNLKMQELFALQAASQVQTSSSSSKKAIEHFALSEKHLEQGQSSSSDQRNDSKPQLIPANVMRVAQTSHAHVGIQNIANNHSAMAAQMQAVQAWAQEHNIDLSSQANMNLISQLIPAMQSRLPSQQKYDNMANSQLPVLMGSRQQVASSPVTNESSPRGNTSSDISGHSGSVNALPFSMNHLPAIVGSNNNIQMQQFSLPGRESQSNQRPSVVGNASSSLMPQVSMQVGQVMDQNFAMRNRSTSSDSQQMQYLKQLNRPPFQATVSPGDGIVANSVPFQSGTLSQTAQQHFGFTKHQLHVLKAQILAFRRLKKGDDSLPQELLQAIAPPPLLFQLQQACLPHEIPHDSSAAGGIENYEKQSDSFGKDTILSSSTKTHVFPKEEDTKVSVKVSSTNLVPKGLLEGVYTGTEEKPVTAPFNKPEPDDDYDSHKTVVGEDSERGRTTIPEYPSHDATQSKKTSLATNVSSQDGVSSKKYHGPLFDFPFFTRRIDSLTPTTIANNNNNLTLAYDVKDLLFEEGVEVLQKKRSENMNRIENLLSVNLEKKRIRPDLVLRLQIEEKKLRLLDVQARLREEIDQQQQEIMAMPDRPYRKFVRLCERQRTELARQVQATQKATREKQLKSIFQWRKKLLEAHWAIRDARIARNRGVAKYHERMLREFSKRKDEDRNKRMEALKNNDVERYRQMLMEQQNSTAGDGGERYAILSSFLTQTEEYLHKLGSKITAAKNQQEMEEAANTAAATAWAQGLSEEEVKAAAACAGEEVMIRNRFSEMNAPRDNVSVNKYYNLAHAVNERVTRQPSMLRVGTLRDYQLVGLQWMLSLYNNKLNGILADEMGLGKTVQVMALIAYLMEFKGNYGPHLIIVPNAVLVNWKSEFLNWLPSVSCLFYVGSKDQRSKLFSQGVCSLKFNVLVTTYEFIMYDRSKLSKVDWKYIIIDEAQRMKDRESVLARDLDKYRCQRRLLLTGTPLQNDLKELWSLLNLLLPEVFDNRKAFHDWFSQPFQKEGPSHNGEDDWLETEKKVIVIHRLHQILEPFMLRRRVEDVEGTLPPKVSIVLRCKMSAMQSSIYDWIKLTGTLRVDPEDEKHRVQKNPLYQIKVYRTLNNRCMELRKTCNHPLLNYPYYSDLSKEFLVRSCGKLWILDRVLLKLHRTGHRVLLFSTMTKLLDILEEYLQWRRLVYRRIDGTTSLEDRETAIVEFNRAGSDCFIFLLSIRAAGRGLNLQSADTVVIYDPDPNPKNEEQAVARAHRIGQTREVKVIYMEAVVDNIPSHQKEDEFRSGGGIDMEDDLAGKDRYVGSIEGLIRNNIQQYKIDMADEVINAGRFDQRTTHEERRLTLETLLHDDERYQETVHDVPSLEEVNCMIARSEEEVDLFDQMDEELDWIEELTKYEQVPGWLRADSKEVNTTVAKLCKKPLKNRVHYDNLLVSETAEIRSELSPKTERKRGRPKGKAAPNYAEIDDYNIEASEDSSVERNRYSVHGEEAVDIGEYEDEETSGAAGVIPNKDRSEEDIPGCDDGGYRCIRTSEATRNNHGVEEPRSSGSSSYSRQLVQMTSPLSSQKFGSLSALDSRPGSFLKRMPDELEEGEIAAISGDSNFDHQQSGSWIHDRDEGEDEQVLQPKIKRKRSVRVRPRPKLERGEGNQDKSYLKIDHKYGSCLRSDDPSTSVELRPYGNEVKEPSLKSGHSFPCRRNVNTPKLKNSPKTSISNCVSSPSEDAIELSKESWDDKVLSTSVCSNFGMKMPEAIKRKCKMVMGKLHKRIDKGQKVIPLLGGLWKRSQNPGYFSLTGNSSLDLRKIDQRIERSEHGGLNDFVLDVQHMLRSSLDFIGFSKEARTEARKVHDLFFEIMKVGFPETDFRELKAGISFAAPEPSPRRAVAPGTAPKRIKPINEVEQEPNRGPPGAAPLQDGVRRRPHPGIPLLLTHPGDLVVCKKRRKEREKSSVAKLRTISLGPGCTAGAGQSADPKWAGADRRGGLLQQQQQQMRPGHVSVGWANPVKRMRTDSGRRRPSHL